MFNSSLHLSCYFVAIFGAVSGLMTSRLTPQAVQCYCVGKPQDMTRYIKKTRLKKTSMSRPDRVHNCLQTVVKGDNTIFYTIQYSRSTTLGDTLCKYYVPVLILSCFFLPLTLKKKFSFFWSKENVLRRMKNKFCDFYLLRYGLTAQAVQCYCVGKPQEMRYESIV